MCTQNTHTRAPREANYHDRMFFTYREEQNRGRRFKISTRPAEQGSHNSQTREPSRARRKLS